MQVVDLKKDLRALYSASDKTIADVQVPALDFLMVDGRGDPNTSREYSNAVEALFAAAYTAKFLVKRGPQAIDFAVMPLEGLWWAEDKQAFAAGRRSDWMWTMMIVQPHFVGAAVLAQAIDEARRKRSLPGLDRIRVESFEEGRCAQVLHVGPYSSEGPTIRRLHEYVGVHGHLTGKHHEIYLSDVRRTDPAKWKTILRQPFA